MEVRQTIFMIVCLYLFKGTQLPLDDSFDKEGVEEYARKHNIKI